MKIKDDLDNEHEVVGNCDCGKPLVACLNSKCERIGVTHATYDDEDWHLVYWSTDKVLERQKLN